MIRKLFVFAAIAMLFFGVQAGTASADLTNNLLVNGGFETGDFTGWTLSSGVTFAFVLPNSGPSPSPYEAQLGTTGPASISQAINTIAGQTYSVSFWLANDDYSGSSYFKALWNGAPVTATPDLQNLVNTAFNYTEFTYTAIGTGGLTTLAFNFQNDNSIYHLTDVDAAATPIPAAVWLFGSGLMGLMGLKRKYLG
jgi:hypothetical protein